MPFVDGIEWTAHPPGAAGRLFTLKMGTTSLEVRDDMDRSRWFWTVKRSARTIKPKKMPDGTTSLEQKIPARSTWGIVKGADPVPAMREAYKSYRRDFGG